MYIICISLANTNDIILLCDMETSKETQKTYIVRMAPSLREKAEKEAQKLGLNFSAYIRYLISAKGSSD